MIACTCERGWSCTRPGVDWPERCKKCNGKLTLTLSRIATVLGEYRNQIYHVDRAGALLPATARRLLDRMAIHFPEAFQ